MQTAIGIGIGLHLLPSSVGGDILDELFTDTVSSWYIASSRDGSDNLIDGSGSSRKLNNPGGANEPTFGAASFTTAPNEYMDTSANAFFTIGAGESATLVWVGTVPGTGTTGYLLNVGSGLQIREWTSPQFAGRAESGATVTDISTTGARGSRVVLAARLDRDSDELEFFVNGTPTGSPADASGVGAINGNSLLVLGRFGTGSYATATHECAAFIKLALTDAQVADAGDALIARNGG